MFFYQFHKLIKAGFKINFFKKMISTTSLNKNEEYLQGIEKTITN